MGYSRHSERTDGRRIGRIRFVLWVVLGLNVAVALAKLAYGLWTGSVAMQADGFHSLFDGASNVVGLFGMSLAGHPADHEHPYGHAKYETYSSAAIGAMLLFAAWNVGEAALRRLLDGGAPPRIEPASFAIMVGTLAVNLFVTSYERRQGRALRSEILIADASHTASDVFVSVGVIGSLAAVKMGYPNADPVIALLVAGAIVHTSWQVLQRAHETLSDRARIPPETVCGVVLKIPGVLGCHAIRTRGSESEVYVDLHIQVDPAVSVGAGHEIAEAVEKAICDGFEQVADVIVHLEPLDDYQSRKTARDGLGTLA